MGTFHRLNALLKIYPIQKINILEHTYKKGILYPLNNLAVASAYLANFNFQARSYKGIDYLREGVLGHASLLTNDTCLNLQDIMMLQDSACNTDDTEFCFANLKLFAYTLPFVSLLIPQADQPIPFRDIKNMKLWN